MRIVASAAGFLLGLSHLLAGTPLLAQPKCEPCEIVLRSEITLGDDPAGPLFRPSTRVIRGENGHYYAAPTYDPGAVAVYDAEGRYLRSVGGAGEGPGEFREIVRHAILRGDTLVVAGQRQILSTFGPDGEHIRSFRAEFPGPFGALAALPGGGFAVQVGFRGDPAIHDPLVMYSGAGEFLGAFPLPEREGRVLWHIAGGDSGLWLTPATMLEGISRLDLAGNPLPSVLTEGVERLRPGEDPPDGITGLLEREGRLFVRMVARDPHPLLAEVRETRSPQDELELARALAEEPPDAFFARMTSFIAVFDVETGALLVSQPIPEGFVGNFVDRDRVGIMRADPVGRILVDVKRLELQGGEPVHPLGP